MDRSTSEVFNVDQNKTAGGTSAWKRCFNDLKKNNNDKNPSAFRDRNLFDSVHFIPFSHSIS